MQYKEILSRGSNTNASSKVIVVFRLSKKWILVCITRHRREWDTVFSLYPTKNFRYEKIESELLCFDWNRDCSYLFTVSDFFNFSWSNWSFPFHVILLQKKWSTLDCNWNTLDLAFGTIWDKVFMNEPSKICGRQPLNNLKGYGLLKICVI